MIPGAHMSHPMPEYSPHDFVAAIRISHIIAAHLVERARVIEARPSSSPQEDIE